MKEDRLPYRNDPFHLMVQKKLEKHKIKFYLPSDMYKSVKITLIAFQSGSVENS